MTLSTKSLSNIKTLSINYEMWKKLSLGFVAHEKCIFWMASLKIKICHNFRPILHFIKIFSLETYRSNTILSIYIIFLCDVKADIDRSTIYFLAWLLP